MFELFMSTRFFSFLLFNTKRTFLIHDDLPVGSFWIEEVVVVVVVDTDDCFLFLGCDSLDKNNGNDSSHDDEMIEFIDESSPGSVTNDDDDESIDSHEDVDVFEGDTEVASKSVRPLVGLLNGGSAR